MKRTNASHLLICILLPVNIALERTDYFFNIFIFSHAIYCKLRNYLVKLPQRGSRDRRERNPLQRAELAQAKAGNN